MEISIVNGKFLFLIGLTRYGIWWSIFVDMVSTLELLVLDELGEVANTSVTLLHLLIELILHLSDTGRRLRTIGHCCIWVEFTFYTVIRKLPWGNNFWQNVWSQLRFSNKRMRYSIELREFTTLSRGHATSYFCSLRAKVATRRGRCTELFVLRRRWRHHSNNATGHSLALRRSDVIYSWNCRKRGHGEK